MFLFGMVRQFSIGSKSGQVQILKFHKNMSPTNSYTPLHTVYIYTVYFFTQGRGEEGELNQREGERATGESTDHKAGLKIPA